MPPHEGDRNVPPPMLVGARDCALPEYAGDKSVWVWAKQGRATRSALAVRGGQGVDRPTAVGMMGAGSPRRGSPQSRPPGEARCKRDVGVRLALQDAVLCYCNLELVFKIAILLRPAGRFIPAIILI